MNIHFKLRAQGKKDPVIVMHIFDSRFTGRKFMLSTGMSIKINLWDKRRDRAKPSPAQAYEDELTKLNQHLDKLERFVISFLGDRHNNKTINRQDLKSLIQESMVDEKELKAKKDEKENQFLKLWQQFIDTAKNKKSGEPITTGTKRSKKQTLTLVEKYCNEKKVKLSFGNIDMNFYHSFDQYMQDEGLIGNTRGKHFKEIKAILHEAEDRDYEVTSAYKKKSFKVIRTATDNIYLNEAEIKKIYNTKLSPAQEKHRDIFIMACYVGARHCDWHQMRKQNVVVDGGKEMFRIKDKKTGAIIHIPIHTAVRVILNKYNGEPPNVIANQKFNEALKTIGKKAELGKAMIDNDEVDKWQEISTHTARRSFATNAYLSRSMDVYQIMKCTGHKTESSFLKYLKLNGKDFALQAADSKFFKDESWSATMKIAS